MALNYLWYVTLASSTPPGCHTCTAVVCSHPNASHQSAHTNLLLSSQVLSRHALIYYVHLNRWLKRERERCKCGGFMNSKVPLSSGCQAHAAWRSQKTSSACQRRPVCAPLGRRVIFPVLALFFLFSPKTGPVTLAPKSLALPLMPPTDSYSSFPLLLPHFLSALRSAKSLFLGHCTFTPLWSEVSLTAVK